MKFISKRELVRVVDMLKSDDREMKRLGEQIMLKRELIRFSLHSIIAFHALLFLATVTAITAWAWDLYPKFQTSMWVFGIMQLFWSGYHCITVALFRKRYNEVLKQGYTPV